MITLIFLVVVSWSSLKGFGTKASDDWLLLSEEKSFTARQVRASRASLRSSMPELPEKVNRIGKYKTENNNVCGILI